MAGKWKPDYSIRTTVQENGAGRWSYQNVDVIDTSGNAIGAYQYNYSMKPPFFAFELDGQWYALYSRDYTAIRVMKLPTCEDIWGQDSDAGGFCPVEFYIPASQTTDFGGDRTGKFDGTSENRPEHFQAPHHDEKHDWTVKAVEFSRFGFVSGCIWGDDSSWKLRFIDLADIQSGVVTIDERFGYVELHPKLTLAETVEVYEEDGSHIRLFVGQDYGRDGEPKE